MPKHRLRSVFGPVGLLLALGALAPSAQAAYEKQVDLQCKFPLVGIKPISVTLSGTLPLRVTDVAPRADVNLSSDALATALRGLGAAKAEGDVAPVIDIQSPGALPETRWVYGKLTPWQSAPTAPLRGAAEVEPFFVQRATTTALTLADLKLNVRALREDGSPLVLPALTTGVDGEMISSWDADPATFVVPCKPAPDASATFAEIQGDEACSVLAPCPAAPAPTEVRGSSQRPTSGTASWRSDYTNPTVGGYIVTLDGDPVEHNVGRGGSYSFSDLTPATEYRGTVRAYSKTTGAPDSEKVSFSFATPIAGKPSVPVVTSTSSTDTTVTLKWSPSTSASSIVGYTVDNIIISGTWAGESEVRGSGTVPEFTWTGLTPLTTYKFVVTAHNASGEQASTAPFFVTTKSASPPVSGQFLLRGTTTLPTLIRGAVPMNSGRLGLTYTPSTGTVSGSFELGTSAARLAGAAALPITIKLGFVRSGSATGTYDGQRLRVSQRMRIKVLEAKLFGAIPLVAGNSCQTKSLSLITLTSGDAGFRFDSGGPLKGTYAISDLNGCGPLEGLVNPAVAGAENSINLGATVDDGPIPD